MLSLRTAVAPSLALVLISGCNLYFADDDLETEPELGSSVQLSIALTDDQCGIDSAAATVTAGDIAPIGPVALTVSATEIGGTITDVPAGYNRNVEVTARNSDGLVVYQGSTMVDVFGGQTSTATVTLFRDFDNCPGTGDIDIDGDLDNDPPTAPAGSLPFGFTQAVYADGIVYLHDAAASRVQRYDVDADMLLTSLVGTDTSVAMAVADAGDQVYLSYVGGRMDVFDTTAGTGSFFGAAPESVSAMAVTGGFVFTIDASGAWVSHALHDRSNGNRVAADDWRHSARSLAWAPGIGRLFLLNSGVSPTDINVVDIDSVAGTLGDETDSPYHGDYRLPNPIRVLPDESLVVVGSGNFFATADLTYATSFGLTFTDIAFHGTSYYLLQEDGASQSQITVLDSMFNIVGTHAVPGAPRSIFAHGDSLVVITQTGMDEHAIRTIAIADL